MEGRFRTRFEQHRQNAEQHVVADDDQLFPSPGALRICPFATAKNQSGPLLFPLLGVIQ
jgi:hypothetical protein